DDGGLGNRIEAKAHRRRETGGARKIDDRAAAALPHGRHALLNRQQVTLEVDVKHLLQDAHLGVYDVAECGVDGGVVDKDIDAAIAGEGGLDQALNLIWLAHVGGYPARFAAGRADSGGDLIDDI